MSIYMRRLFPKSNSSFPLRTGVALKAAVSRLRDGSFLVDAGIGSPRTCTPDELTQSGQNLPTKFEDLVGFQGSPTQNAVLKKRILERVLVDLMTGEPLVREQAASKVNDMVGAAEVYPGEPLLYLPVKFRQERAWMELNRIWRTNKKVRGFVLARLRQGYLVGIAGYVAFLHQRTLMRSRLSSDHFTVESINPTKRMIVVSQ